MGGRNRLRRQRWRRKQIHLTDVGPDQPGVFLHRIAGDGYSPRQAAVDAFCRDRHALALAVVTEAVIPALQLVTADEAFRQRSPAMGAAIDEQVRLAGRIAPQHQVLAQAPDGHRLVRSQVGRFEHRPPAVSQAGLQALLGANSLAALRAGRHPIILLTTMEA